MKNQLKMRNDEARVVMAAKIVSPDRRRDWIAKMNAYEEARAKLEKKGLKPKPKETPLRDKECSFLSIYKMDTTGGLWTIDGSGKAFRQVRKYDKKLKEAVYVCVKCKKANKDFGKAVAHG